MSRKPSAAKLSSGEMEIMDLLWQRGEATIAEAHEAFERPIGYTTMQTRLNRLVTKGWVKKSDERPARYAPAISQNDVSAGHLDLLMERVTSGSVVPLVAQLLGKRQLTDDEISELKGFIAQAEAKNDKGGKTK